MNSLTISVRRLPKIRRPPKDYVFKEDDYRSDSLVDFGNKLRRRYSELRGWDGGSIASAWGAYTEATCGVCQYMEQTRRDRNFLAYLYAEQEMRPLGLMVRDDGVEFIFYSLHSLGPFWEEYDMLMSNRNSTPAD